MKGSYWKETNFNKGRNFNIEITNIWTSSHTESTENKMYRARDVRDNFNDNIRAVKITGADQRKGVDWGRGWGLRIERKCEIKGFSETLEGPEL